MVKEFEFTAEGRSYACTIEERRGTKGEFWWWFTVSGDAQMYAPFQTEKGDTQKSVQERVLAFYNNRLFAIAQPSKRGGGWGQQRPPVAPPVPIPTTEEAAS
jgi:hypothetical protein